MSHPTTTVRLIRVFLASPGDVAKERKIAQALLDELQNSTVYRAKLKFEVVVWERPGSGAPMLAHLSPQEAITLGRGKPAECDIVLVIFWSRMGTPLPQEFALKSTGERYQSGTEWEFWNAVEAAQQNNGHPRVLLYRRDEEPQTSLRDPQRDEKVAQWDKVEQFFQSLNHPDGTIRHSHTSYPPGGFKNQLRADLEAVLENLLQETQPSPADGQNTTTPSAVTLPLPAAFQALKQQLAALDDMGGEVPELEADALRALLSHAPQSLEQYRLARIAEWSQTRYELNKRFTPLTLLLFQEDQGYMPHPSLPIKDLRDLFTQQPDAHAFVLLGAPGCGKSTLLRRMELDLARDELLKAADAQPTREPAKAKATLSFYLSLNRYQSQEGRTTPEPLAWLEQSWAAAYPGLPPLTDILRNHRVVLLLDALNEMPHRNFAEFRHLVGGRLAATDPAFCTGVPRLPADFFLPHPGLQQHVIQC